MDNVFFHASWDASIPRATGSYELVKGLGGGLSRWYEWYLRV